MLLFSIEEELMSVHRPLDLGVIKEHIDRHASTHEIFMDLVGAVIGRDSEAYPHVEEAAESIMSDFHHIRRHTGEEYVVHQRSVAVIGMMYSRIRDPRIIVADLLHDTIEDIEGTTLADMRTRYGRKVAHIVSGMTKPPLPEQGLMDKAAYDETCSQIIFKHVRDHGKDCMKAKCRDRLHNMLTLWSDSDKKLRKIKETVQFVLPISIHVDYLWRELTMATSEQLARLHIDDTLA
jgi:(p)ppGpp synthase/HD superfamily hydrolase